MKPGRTDPHDEQINIEQRMRTVRTLWLALLVSVGLYYGVTMFAGRPETVEPNSTMSLTLLVVGLSTALISFLVKNKLITRAIERRQAQQVQQAHVIAWAMSEVAALLGLLDFFATSDPYFYVLFIIAALAQLLHFPRREPFENAAFNPRMNL